MSTTAEKTKRLVVRNLKVTRRQPDPPHEVSLNSDGTRITWRPPQNRTGVTHYRVWIDHDGGDPDFEVSEGQRSVVVPSGVTFYVASYNSVMGLASKKIRVSARSTAAGLEYAPNVTGIAGAIERRDTDGGIQQWRYSLTWAEPTTDLRYRLVAAYVIYVDDGGGDRTRVVELPKGSTAYVSEWANVPSPAETYKIRVVSKATLGGENPIVEGVTPTYEVTVSYTAGGSGVEYTGNVTITGAATVQYPGKADGTYQAIISIPFSAPASDPTWGSVDMVAYDGVTYLTLTKADSVSPCDAVVTPPATIENWDVYLVSRDTAGRRNSITASTPKATIAIGSASGQLNGAKIVAGSVSTVHLDAEGISVGGGGGKPGVFQVFNASGTQNGFIGMDGRRTGVVNTNGTAVTRTSGDVFVAAMAGLPIDINGTVYTVASVGGASNLTLTGSAGVQNGKAYIGWTGQGIWGDEVRAGGTSFSAYKFRAHTTGVEIIDGSLSLNKNGITTALDNLFDSGSGKYVGMKIYETDHTARRLIATATQMGLYADSGVIMQLVADGAPPSYAYSVLNNAVGGQNIVFDTSGPAVVAINGSGAKLNIDGNTILKARKTGWSTATGTASRAAFDTATVTTEELAKRVKALIDDLHATAGHGLIGA